MSVEARTEQVDERLLSPRELSSVLGLGLTSTYALLSSGEIPSVRLGRLRKVRRSDVDRYIAAHLERHDD